MAYIKQIFLLCCLVWPVISWGQRPVTAAAKAVCPASYARVAVPGRSAAFYQSVCRAPGGASAAVFNLKRRAFSALRGSGLPARTTAVLLQKIGFAPNKRFLGFTPSVAHMRAQLPKRLGVSSLDEAYASLARDIESLASGLPEQVVFKGILFETPRDLLALLTEGMPMARIRAKTPLVVGADAAFINHAEMESLCFGRAAAESVPYAFGEGIARVPPGGIIAVAAVRRTPDMAVQNGVLTLRRDVKAQEIAEVWVFDSRYGRWYGLRAGAAAAEK